MHKYLYILLLLILHFTVKGQTFNGSGGAIAGSSTTQTCYNATVTGVGIINGTKGLAQLCLNITHPNTDELEIVLTAPDGTIVPLTVQNGGSGNNYTNTCFTATAATSIKFGTSPFTGSFLPEGYLGAVNNGQNANGIWKLCIHDRRTASNAGTLNNWGITFNNTPAPLPPSFPACTSTLPAGSSCANATPVCDFNGVCGNTNTNTVQDWTGSGLGTCFGLQNNSFIKFIASATTVSFSIWVPTSSGSFENGGIQMLFFSGTCNSGAVTSHGCYPHIFAYNNAAIPLVTNVSATGLTIGNTYYLMIDGFNNANCTFRIAANTGINILSVTPSNPTICNGQSVNLTASGANGIYAWSPSVNLSTTSGTTVTVNPTSNQTYTVTSSSVGGCPITKNVTVNVTPVITPTTIFSYAPNTVCANGSNPTLSTVTGFTTGGTYAATPSGLSINATTGAINVAASTAGNYTITYSVAASGCNPAASNTTNFSIGTNISPIVNFFYQSDNVCVNSPNPPIIYGTGFTTGGVFTVSPAGLSINTSTGAVNLATSSAGIYTVTYTIVANGCILAASSTSPITITTNTTPNTNFNYSPNTVCNNAANATINTSGTFSSGGTFSATPTGLTINTATGTINVAASTPGNYTITYTLAANGCIAAGSSSSTFSITAISTAVTGFSYSTNSVCINGANPSIITNAGFTSGGIFTASPAGLNINATTGAINVAASIAGNYTITYTLAAAGCIAATSSTASFLIANTIIPTTGFSFTPNIICSNGANPVLTTAAGFTTGGIFSATPAGLNINPTTGSINIAASNTGNYTISYTLNANSCVAAASSNTTLSIGNNNAAITNFNYSPNSVCANAANPTINTATGFTSGGVFTATPAGLSIDANTGAINVSTSLPGIYIIAYNVAATGCNNAGNNTAAFTVNPVSIPNTIFNYSPNNICNNAANPILNTSNLFTAGGVFTALPNGLQLNANTGAINTALSLPGSYTITYTIAANGCNPSSSNTANITINAVQIPITNFSYSPQVFCNATTNPTLVKAAGFSANGIFSATPNGLAINSNTGAINIANSIAGNYLITYQINANGCTTAGSSTANLVINTTSPKITGFNYLPDTICTNSTALQLQTTSGFTTGGVFTSSPVGLAINNITGVIDVAASNAGNYSITYTIPADACNALASSNSKLVVQPTPSTPIINSPTAILCGANNVTFLANSNGTINWYNQPALQTIVATGNSFDTLLQQSTSLYATATNGICTSASAATTVQILPLPKKPFIGNDTAICLTDKLILNAGLYDTYLWQDGSTNATFTVANSGMYSVKITNLGNCSNADTVAINVLNDCNDINFANSFSPNGDGVNETFGPLGNVFLLSKFQLSIYNRYGQLIYHSNNPYQKWDGKKEVQRNGSASYVWYCTYTFKGISRIKKGNILVIK